MVQPNGIADWPGTRLSALLHTTSWNVTPANSGVVTLRISPSRRPNPGSAPGESTPALWLVHLTYPVEHMFYRDASTSAFQR